MNAPMNPKTTAYATVVGRKVIRDGADDFCEHVTFDLHVTLNGRRFAGRASMTFGEDSPDEKISDMLPPHMFAALSELDDDRALYGAWTVIHDALVEASNGESRIVSG